MTGSVSFQRAVTLSFALWLAAASAGAQEAVPAEVQNVDLRTNDKLATVVLRSEEPVEWSAEPEGRTLVVFLPRTVPGPDALDRSSRTGLVSLVEVGFAVPEGVPTTRITIHCRNPFKHEVEASRGGLTIRLKVDESRGPASPSPPQPVASSVQSATPEPAELEQALRDNALLRQRMSELHADRLELRESLESARKQLEGLEREGSAREGRGAELEQENLKLSQQIESEKKLRGEQSESLSTRLSAEQAKRLESQQAAEQLRARLEELQAELESARSAAASRDAAQGLAKASERERRLEEQLRESRADSSALRAWLSKAPEVLQAREFVVGPGESCLPLQPEPVSSATVLECLAVGSSVEALSFRPDWLRVRTETGKEGWVSATRLAALQRPADESAVAELEGRVAALARELETEKERAQASAGGPAERQAAQLELGSARTRIAELEADLAAARSVDPALSAWAAVSRQMDSCLTLRAGPGTDQARLDCLEPGTAVSIQEATADWLRVQSASGLSGWVASQFVEVRETGESKERVAALEQSRRTLEEEVNALRNRIQSSEASKESESARLEALEGELAASRQQSEALAKRIRTLGTELETNDVAARKAAEARAAELQQANADLQRAREALAALEERQQLERTEALGALKVAAAVVKEDVDPCLSFREEPAVGSRALDCLAPGTPVETIALAGGWFGIRLEDGREGWSSGEFLEPMEQRELRQVRQRLAESEQSLASAEARLAEAESGDAEAQTLSRELEESRREAARLAQELAETEELRRSQAAEFKISSAESERQLVVARQEIESLRSLAEQSGEVPVLTSALEQARGALTASEARTAELERELSGLSETRTALDAARAAESESDRALAEARAELALMRESLAESESSKAALTERVSNLESEQAASISAGTAAGTEGDELRDRVAELQAQIEGMRGSIEAVKRANSSLRAELESTRRTLERAEAQVSELEGSKDAVAQVLEPLPSSPAKEAVSEKAVVLPPMSLPSAPKPAVGDDGPVEPSLEVVAADLEAFARAWAQAWSEQRVEDYLSFYAVAFEPPDGMSRNQWEQVRNQRLTRPEFIQVELSNFEFEIAGADAAIVTFDQQYRSNTFEDRVRKTLELVREGELWRIGRETAQ